MSRTIRHFKGQTFREKSRRERKDKKFFGFTSGTHSYYLGTDRMPMKGVDYIKYGYGSPSNKRIKHYKKEI